MRVRIDCPGSPAVGTITRAYLGELLASRQIDRVWAALEAGQAVEIGPFRLYPLAADEDGTTIPASVARLTTVDSVP